MTKKPEIINKTEFVAVAVGRNNTAFIVYIVSITELTIIPDYSFCQAQIIILSSKNAKILFEYSDFSHVFLPNTVVELLEYKSINHHLINVIDNKLG